MLICGVVEERAREGRRAAASQTLDDGGLVVFFVHLLV